MLRAHLRCQQTLRLFVALFAMCLSEFALFPQHISFVAQRKPSQFQHFPVVPSPGFANHVINVQRSTLAARGFVVRLALHEIGGMANVKLRHAHILAMQQVKTRSSIVNAVLWHRSTSRFVNLRNTPTRDSISF